MKHPAVTLIANNTLCPGDDATALSLPLLGSNKPSLDSSNEMLSPIRGALETRGAWHYASTRSEMFKLKFAEHWPMVGGHSHCVGISSTLQICTRSCAFLGNANIDGNT